jgi:CRP/FNR family transcriptional regulator, cyclic AMP receptor protein
MAAMEDMDFTGNPPPTPPAAASAPFKAANSRYYNATVAARLFQSAGKAEHFAAGQVIFAESQKASTGGLFSLRSASRMYFLAEGEVALTIAGKPLDAVKPREVFGEMAVITGRPRSATATARSDCTLYSVSEEELRSAFAGAPEFALMLMSVMFDRLRFVGARLVSRGAAISRREDIEVFAPALLQQLEDVLVRPMLTQYQQGAPIMREGQAGMVMYVVKEGRVAITLGGNVVESVGPGGIFGEIALVDQSPRTASATAEQWSELLAVDRASLLECVRQQPAFAMAMLRAIAERLRHMNAQLG